MMIKHLLQLLLLVGLCYKSFCSTQTYSPTPSTETPITPPFLTTTTQFPTTTTRFQTTTTQSPTTTTQYQTTTPQYQTTTTKSPTTTTQSPTTTTPKPTTTTQSPKTTTTLKPTITTQSPTTITTQTPTTTTPPPTTTPAPKPTTTTQSSTTTTPLPTTTTQSPTTTTHSTTTTILTQTTTTPSPTTTIPTPSTPDPRANKSVCYGDLGCFDNFPPFNNAFLDLPVDPEKINTTFYLYTRHNKAYAEGQLLNYTDQNTIRQSHFDSSKEIKFIIHGFSNDLYSEWLHRMKDELLKADDFNVVIVGWGNGATFPDYAQAVANTRLVATQTQRLILQFVNLGAKLDAIHLIGHSLGAHTSGYCGFLLGGKLKRITGLDLAGPEFDLSPHIVVLDKTDAQFVDIVHTNAKALAEGGAGLYNSSGHVDFYVNGGRTQPGCHDGISAIFNGGDIKDAIACSHGRSHNIFIESINSQCPFTAYPCDIYTNFERGKCLSCGKTGCSVLGYYSDQYYARGRMFVDTAAKEPFCGYHYSVTVYGGKAEETKGKLSIRLRGKWGDSGFIPITRKDEVLKGGATFAHVMVSPQEVGDVEEVTIKYEKNSGFWFGKSKESYVVEKLDIVSGENGSSYLFCLEDKELKHGTEVQAVKSSAKYRC